MAKRKTNETTSSNLLTSHSDVYGLQNSRRKPYCSRHMEASSLTLPKRITRQGAQETRGFTLTDPCFLRAIPRRERTKRDSSIKKAILDENHKLDSNVFECYLEHFWRNLSEDKRASCTYLDCLWYTLYRKPENKAKVLTWIKSKHIFSRKYVFVPIVCWSHWSLLILCHFGERFDSKTRRPCMLLLDSLEKVNPKRLEPDIRKFVFDIYKEEGRPEKKGSIAKIPLLVPKVPQQKNAEDCGLFVLYFIKLFLESAPENFNSFEDPPYFMNENWVTAEGLENFFKEVRIFWRKMKERTEPWGKKYLGDWKSSIAPIVV